MEEEALYTMKGFVKRLNSRNMGARMYLLILARPALAEAYIDRDYFV